MSDTTRAARGWLRTPEGIVSLGSLLVAGLCTLNPLTAVLGFERALASALYVAIAAPILGARAASRTGSVWSAFGQSVAGASALLLPSLLVGALYEALTLPCDMEMGATYFLLLGGGNAAFGAALGVGLRTLFQPRSRPALWTGLAVALVDLLWLGATLARLYAEPQVFIYSTPFGYWPGSIYDESLRITPALWGFRGFGLLLSSTLVCAASGLRGLRNEAFDLRAWSGALALGLGALWVHGHGEALGFELDRTAIVEALGYEIRTEHFVIHADPSLGLERLDALALEHEMLWERLERRFETAPEPPITSFVYASPEQKGVLMGASRTQVARPWINEIHVHGAEVPHRVLEHELAHVFAGALSSSPLRIPTLFGVIPNIGLIEGVAVAADWPAREMTVHQWAAAMLELGHLPKVSQTLDPVSFWQISSSRAYVALGSFVRWLLDTRGMARLGALYDGASFERVYGRPAAELEVDWRAFLLTRAPPPAELRLARHRFARPSIFEKTCARAAANLDELAATRLSVRDFEDAEGLTLRLMRLAPADPAPMLRLARAYFEVDALERAREWAERARLLDAATETARLAAVELLGEIAWKDGDLERATEAFSEVLEHHLSTPSDRLQAVRLEALASAAQVREPIRAYLMRELSPGEDVLVLTETLGRRPDHTILAYLESRLLERIGVPARGLTVLDGALRLPTAALRDEARLTRGRLAFQAGLLELAREYFLAALQETERPVIRAIARDWLERTEHRTRSERNTESTASRFDG